MTEPFIEPTAAEEDIADQQQAVWDDQDDVPAPDEERLVPLDDEDDETV